MKRSSLLDDLILLPWWFSIILACIAYVGLRHWLPIIELSSPALQGMARGLSSSASFIAGIFMFTAALSAFHSWRKGELLNRQTSVKSIQNLPWKDFEFLVSEAYRRKGFAVSENRGGGADGGVDLVLVKNGQKTLV